MNHTTDAIIQSIKQGLAYWRDRKKLRRQMLELISDHEWHEITELITEEDQWTITFLYWIADELEGERKLNRFDSTIMLISEM